LLKSNQHAENLAYGSPQAARDFTGVVALGVSGKQLKNVEPFIEGWRIVALVGTIPRGANL
jgi:hypothetical protein